MEGNPTAVPDRLARAYKLVVDVEKLYWDADYHGLHCNDQSCDCLVPTHEKRTYPALWKKLEKMERLAKSEPKPRAEMKEGAHRRSSLSVME